MISISILCTVLLVPAGSFKVSPLQKQLSTHSKCLTSFARNSDHLEEQIHSTSDLPITSRNNALANLKFLAWSSAFAVATAVITNALPAAAAVGTTESIYKDTTNGFSVLVEPGWSIMPRKTPTPTMLQYASEEVLFTGSRFNEGGGASSLSVTRTNAVRLLKDFEIEWWFAPLNSMADLGSADLIAGLLILQRQGEFEKRESPSSVKNAKISADGILTFDFTTPLGSIYVRNTAAKAIFRDKKLLVVWLSALTTFWEGEYGEKLNTIKDSFKLEDIVKRS